MKIVLLVSSMNSGGAERVAATLCNAWARREDDVTLMATYSGRGECHYALADGVRLVYLADLVNGGGGRILGYGARVGALHRFIKEQTPDIVISFLTNVNIMAALALRGSGIPLILSERIDPGASTDFPAYMRWLCRLVYPVADVVTVQTESIASAMRALTPRVRRIEVIPNPIPEAVFETPPPRRHPQQGERRRLLGMGRLSPQKQMDHLVGAFEALASEHPDVDLWIWGEGELKSELERQVREAGLEQRIFLPGRTSTPWAEMAGSEMLVLVSAYEGFPNVMLEAMALGLPCVAYDCPSGPRELSDEGKAAVLVPLNDRERLRAEIARLLVDPDARQRIGARAAASVRQRYCLASILAEWDRLILAARGARGSAIA